MQTTPTHLIFATNFSETCHAAIPTVAQLVDRLRARLTILHVHAKGKRAQARQSLDAFFAEASNYPGCERALASGPAAAGIVSFCRSRDDALLIMPPSERTGLPRPLHVSLRARVLERVATPMLTLPYADAIPRDGAGGGHVACWITGRETSLDTLRDAAAMARRRGADLHLLHVMPDISEGLLVDSLFNDKPLTEAAAVSWLSDLVLQLRDDDLRVRLHVAVGNPRREIAGLLKRACADVLVVEHDAVVRRGVWRSSLQATLAKTPCVLICLPPSHLRRPAIGTTPNQDTPRRRRGRARWLLRA
ncbi:MULTISPECIES: universal stress protein [Xanthomonas]|uniref:Nucleotide-binding universal stress UspA family protein n=1 Tax=Xanthomonas cannabis TaxID=1885674 RepID=A0ABR6JNV1_9XANT|nr:MULTISPECIES: universal stress protein [Xanthomonas]MBB4594504.1 nucleotide-binding universal stress UspA family protein [Xanthomonas cannabis]MBB5521511.1 nucleotide-binding universal stress UspA family protein [Xanthomonas cannabis]NIK18428.1 nucleotide-binding universal stress UspA family protein [Xanthomonas cannabis]